METIRRTKLLLLALLGALAACGQKGPLYLPDPAREIVTRPATAPPAGTDASPTQTTPAPEVAAPQIDKDKKKDQGAATPPPLP